MKKIFLKLIKTLLLVGIIACSEETSFSRPKVLPNNHDLISITETFVQEEITKEVDIIWVIDNSSSMKNEQIALAKNFSDFIDLFLENKIDFNMGITTTDTTGRGSKTPENGEFVGRSPIITSQMPSSMIKTTFMTNILVGTDGSGRERGLEGALLATQNSFNLNSVNYSFLRENANLVIIFVSDENDISPESTLFYIETLQALKPNSNMVTFCSIIDTRTESFVDPFTYPIELESYYATQWNNPGGKRYINASQATSGIIEDIHSDFAKSLINIGNKVITLVNSFTLSNKPVQDSITVKINNTPVARAVNKESSVSWYYDVIKNAVVFGTESIPAKNDLIEISYTKLQSKK